MEMRPIVDLAGVSGLRLGDEHWTHFRYFSLWSEHKAALGVTLAFEAIRTQILQGRRVVGITVVVVVVRHVVRPWGSCTSAEILRSAKITLSVELHGKNGLREKKGDEERSRVPYPYLSLDEGIDVGRAVLKKLVCMTRFALWDAHAMRAK
jgi:hypothetical protein